MFTSKPKIRTRTVAVTVKKPAPARAPASTSSASSGRRKPSGTAPTGRYSLTPSNRVRTPAVPSREPARPSLSVSSTHQRKRKVTPSTPQWASSSDESSDDDEAGARKRQKTSSSTEPATTNRSLEPDLQRRIRIQEPDSRRQESGNGATAAGEKKAGREPKLVHGLNMSRGEWIKDFKPAFPGSNENLVVELQYPSMSRPERFETVVPYDNSNFNPLDDIYFSMEEIIQHYLPSDLSASLSSETDGAVRLLKRAVGKNSPDDFQAALNDFNSLIRKKLEDKTITKVLDAIHAIPLSLTKRILAQVYQRTVSPYAHLLRKVKGKETTYGELLPPFVHGIFQQTSLNSASVFVDLGSGVGNVVLQSALQTGAESWGIEIMDNPAKYAIRQAAELRARAKLWNISLGPITLHHGDFLESAPIDTVLRRADVVLCNNKVFPEKLNGALLDKFLDLKQGCKVVSLASFVGGGAKQGVRNEQSIANLFEEERFDSGTYSVSWAGESVEYFIATKVR
ncbi:DOT1-domain-containing protein [Melanomma pulvis-pyrius CBS 109.77]|uniref:Histone-lysine N-methyltransferase, H3 lysine-79 specific n=1 Tax=Melanomma pulvis-pyrius CBS 109.77 TaxID=1314802 RepID=A0A6A6X0V5_9PLEO|nr:DOT1-domain-containing protein [Melanomma pulvis-pyrius CBS 109.77]